MTAPQVIIDEAPTLEYDLVGQMGVSGDCLCRNIVPLRGPPGLVTN